MGSPRAEITPPLRASEVRFFLREALGGVFHLWWCTSALLQHDSPQRVRGGEPEGVKKHLLSKKVFLCSKRFLERKRRLLRNLWKPSKNPFSF